MKSEIIQTEESQPTITQLVDRRAVPSYKFHPSAEKQPEWNEKDFKRLVADVEINGIINPIKLLGGKIIDGRHRYKAWQEVFGKKSATSCDEAIAWIKKYPVKTEVLKTDEELAAEISLSLNNFSRNPNKDQLAIIAINHLKEHHEEYKARHWERISKSRIESSVKKHSTGKDLEATEEIGQMLGVSKSKIMKVQQFIRQHPDYEDDIFQGRLTLSAAKKKANIVETTAPKKPTSKQVEKSFDTLMTFKEDIPELTVLMQEAEALIQKHLKKHD
jgi:hypothetical protein